MGGRILRSLACGPELTIGEGGAVIVPGLGGEVALLVGGRIVPGADLVGELRRGDTAQAVVEPMDAWPAAGVSLEGARATVSPRAHPHLEITVEPLATLALERARWTLIPARETLFAGALAGVLALMLGRTALLELTAPEREVEREDTALTRAVYATPNVVPTFVAPRIIRYAELPEPPAVVEPPPIAVAVAEETVPPVAVPQRDAKPKRSRRALPRATTRDSVMLLDSLSNTAELSSLLGGVPHETFANVLGAANVGGSGLDIFDLADPLGGGDGVAGGVVGSASGELRLIEPPARSSSIEPIAIKRSHEPDGPLDSSVVDSAEVTNRIEPIARVEPIEQAAVPPADPHHGRFELADAFAGLAATQPGTLTAKLHTSKGVITCALLEDRAPRTVANFVGLALGTRQWLDAQRNVWVAKPFYDGLTFHRVIRGFMIQGGDPSDNGRGGPGYEIADEVDVDLDHDAAGVLSMANKGPNTAGSQFFVTLGAARHLDGKHTVFGKCDVEAAGRIGEVEVDTKRQDRPRESVTIRRVEILRVPEPSSPKPVPVEAQPLPDGQPSD